MTTPPDKSHVVRVLREVARLLEGSGEASFRVRAYDLAADRLAASPVEPAELVRKGALTELPGIGPSLAAHITELLTLGRMKVHEQLKADLPPGFLELIEIPELGPKKASALWRLLGVGDPDALERACREGRVRGLKGFGERTEQKLLEGLATYRQQKAQAEDRFPLGTALRLGSELLARLRAHPAVVRAELAGSARRFCELVSDLDLVASSPRAREVLGAFSRDLAVERVEALGETLCSVRLWKGPRVDLRVVQDEDFATALHHLTGSKAHHVRVRGRAQSLGLRLSEWGLFQGEEKLPIPTEDALYAALGMQPVPPELREDAGEVEAALAGTLPRDLLTLADVQGVVHSHSTWSDGKDSLEEMARAAEALGHRYLTVTEHSQTAHYARGLREDDLRRQWDEIDALNERLSTLRLLKGVESDILEDGSLDYPDAVLERLEVVIGSIHHRHGMDEEAMTRRLLAAMDNPHLHILGHLTGRLLLRRPPFALAFDRLLEKAQRRGVAIEVNGSPQRLDLKADQVRRALAAGVSIVVSADAHQTAELANLVYAVGTARKGWARRGEVLNTLPAGEFSDHLRGMRR